VCGFEGAAAPSVNVFFFSRSKLHEQKSKKGKKSEKQRPRVSRFGFGAVSGCL